MGKSETQKVRSKKSYSKAKWTARIRANFRDEISGKRCEIDAHHIKPVAKFPELACDPSNIIMICVRVHHEYVHDGHEEVLNGMPDRWVIGYRNLYLQVCSNT